MSTLERESNLGQRSQEKLKLKPTAESGHFKSEYFFTFPKPPPDPEIKARFKDTSTASATAPEPRGVNRGSREKAQRSNRPIPANGKQKEKIEGCKGVQKGAKRRRSNKRKRRKEAKSTQ